MGFSWGSVIGAEYAKRHPENVRAYIGEYLKGVIDELLIDFGPAKDAYDNVRVEKRSESNVVLYINEKTDKEYSIQYSSMPGKFSDESQRERIFPDGYESAETGDGYKVLYTFEKEDNGTRAIIMQEVANDHYVSIRSFNDVGMNNSDFVKSIVINANYPMYNK